MVDAPSDTVTEPPLKAPDPVERRIERTFPAIDAAMLPLLAVAV